MHCAQLMIIDCEVVLGFQRASYMGWLSEKFNEYMYFSEKKTVSTLILLKDANGECSVTPQPQPQYRVEPLSKEPLLKETS